MDMFSNSSEYKSGHRKGVEWYCHIGILVIPGTSTWRMIRGVRITISKRIKPPIRKGILQFLHIIFGDDV